MPLTPSATLESALDNYSKAAERNREYGNKRLNTKLSVIKPGSVVLVKQPKLNKLTAPYRPETTPGFLRKEPCFPTSQQRQSNP